MIMEKKISTPAEFLCKGYPGELAQFLNYAKGLKFQEKPDYKYLKHLLTQAMKNNKIEMDYVYDWSNKVSTQNIPLEVKKSEEKKEKKNQYKPEPKVEQNKKKEEAIDQALNSFQLNGGSLLKPGKTSHGGTSKEVARSLNKTGQVSKNSNNILSSVGLETLVSTKITMPKISVIRK